MVLFKKAQLAEMIDAVRVNHYEDNIYISSINGKITIEGSNNGKKVGTDDRTFATTNSPIDLKLAELENEKIRVISKNGVVYIQKVKAKEIVIEAANGCVVLENCIANKFNVETNNGNIVLKNIVAKDVETRTANGTLEACEIIFQRGNICIENTGSVFFRNIAASEDLKLMTRSGKISGESIIAKTAAITTNCGNIELEKAVFEDGFVHSDNGSIEVETIKSFNTDNVKSNNGKVKIKYFSNNR